MRQIRGFVGFLYRHSFVRYVFVGGSTFAIDLGLLVLCHETLDLPIEIATTISYWTSIAYNFSLNRWWTFDAAEAKNIREHALLYGTLIGFNYLFNLAFISIMSEVIHYGIAKVLATAIAVSWTYLAYKHVIFKKPA